LLVDRKIKELVKQEKDPRLAEVFLTLHRIYMGKMERVGRHAG
ncbi:MAG: hydrogenase, partial [Thermoanaerobacteraceae bacterium]|nr:hydrogenase [Thermoanaerobacteraceae bacterium]